MSDDESASYNFESHETAAKGHEDAADALDEGASGAPKEEELAGPFEGSQITSDAGTVLVPAMSTLLKGAGTLGDRLKATAQKLRAQGSRMKEADEEAGDALKTRLANYGKDHPGDTTPVIRIPKEDVPKGDDMDRWRLNKLTDGVDDEDRPKVKSTKLGDDEENELTHAVERARLADGKYGRDPRANYVAIRCVDENGKDVIVVGRSWGGRTKTEFTPVHSEQAAGIAISKAGWQVKEIYTERAPCSRKDPNCEVWLQHYLGDNWQPAGSKVEATYKYKNQGEVDQYVKKLFQAYPARPKKVS
jgi:hypothetical protein